MIEAIEMSNFLVQRKAFENRMYDKSLQETRLHWRCAEL